MKTDTPGEGHVTVEAAVGAMQLQPAKAEA